MLKEILISKVKILSQVLHLISDMDTGMKVAWVSMKTLWPYLSAIATLGP